MMKQDFITSHPILTSFLVVIAAAIFFTIWYWKGDTHEGQQ